jgi:DNA helicase II / ATP-dependent DNA helicase PcrA
MPIVARHETISPHSTTGATTAVPAETLGGVLGELNPEQRAAAIHGEDPLLIVAGAGTGKTTTLAHRVAHHIATGTDPRRILLLTFTRRAAAEMARRVDAILRRAREEAPDALGSLGGGAVWSGTFHAIGTRLLRLHGPSIGLDPSFTILDRADSEDLMGVVRTKLGLCRTDRRFPQKGTCFDIYSRCVNSGKSLEDVLQRSFPYCRGYEDDLKELFGAYVDRKTEANVLDFDDLLLFWDGLLADPIVGDEVRRRFDKVLVDEYQDTNAIQARIVHGLRLDGKGVTAVGDDAQSIYSFRAAEVRNILDFPVLFPGTTVVPLEQNYRSTQPILSATNRVIAEAAERHEKELWTAREGGERPALVSCTDEDEQTDFVVRRVLEHREAGLALKQQAVLFRAAHHSLPLEVELARRNIPFRKYGGLRFTETAHVKDLSAFLRLAENPGDLPAGLRVLTLLPGVGPKTAETLMESLSLAGGDFTTWADSPPPGAAARSHWPNLVSLMVALSAVDAEPIAAQVHAVRAVYKPLLQARYDNAEARLRDLEEIERISGRFEDRQSMIAEMALDPPAWAQDLAGPPLIDEDYLVLSTMHSAKGLEWDAVYIIHAADGNIPSDMATGSVDETEEERRLFYVACTRARDWLYICHPLRYYKSPWNHTDSHGYSQLTRFVTDSVRPTLRAEQGGERTVPEGDPVSTGHIGTDIRAKLRARWV